MPTLTVKHQGSVDGPSLDRTLDRILTSRWTGFPVMILLLAGVLWLTIAGANYPSAVLSWLLLDTIHPALKSGAATIGMPWWLSGVLIDGVYLATAWVVSVMLPPMAIFFPLFTLLEDFGYLPRVAFNLDGLFRRAGAHGKQALTMCMGLGCNAAGVIATRVIESPRERLIAIITNNFALCNGRWPTQILLATIFLGTLVPPYLAGAVSAMAVVLVALLGVLLTFVTSWGLSRTVLRGEPSTFHLELPPYRPPRLLQTLYTSLIDRTIFVLWRAIVFAVPAGAIIWLISNLPVGDSSLAEHLVTFLNPVGVLIGLNGVILLAYLVAIPANEIVIPTILMLTVVTAGIAGSGEGAGVMFQLDSPSATREILAGGRMDRTDRRERDALQPGPQSLLHNDLHDLEGNGQFEVDSACDATSACHGDRVVFRCHSILAAHWRITMGQRLLESRSIEHRSLSLRLLRDDDRPAGTAFDVGTPIANAVA